MPRLWPVGLIVISALGSQLPGLDGWTQIHTSNDHIPDSATNPTISSSANGLRSSPATWIPSRGPLSSDRVRITHAVTFDSTAGEADVIGVDAGGTLRLSTTQATRLRVATLMVLANGALEVGTSSTPIPPSFTPATSAPSGLSVLRP